MAHEHRVKHNESFQEEFENAEIAASGNEGFPANRSAEIERYGPWNYLDVNNTSAIDVDVDLDGDSKRRFFLESGTGITIDPKDNIFYHTISIKNKNGSTVAAANTIKVVIAKVLTPDSLLRP